MNGPCHSDIIVPIYVYEMGGIYNTPLPPNFKGSHHIYKVHWTVLQCQIIIHS